MTRRDRALLRAALVCLLLAALAAILAHPEEASRVWRFMEGAR